MTARLDWARDAADWPLREASRFVAAAGMHWHVQVLGAGPVLLLLHGTGASTHSWRDFAPMLTARFTVVAPDLPGHGFSDAAPPGGASLPGMSRGVAALLKALRVAAPSFVVGHSAGAAILARMALDGASDRASNGARPLAGIVAINGAFVPFAGPLRIFSPVAKFLASTSLASHLTAARARDPRAVARLLDGTGSRLDERGRALYARLVQSPAHVAGALKMMASWDLDALERDLPRLAVPMLLLAGSHDKTVPPGQAARTAAVLPNARAEILPGLGHLAHEEDPQAVVNATLRFFDGLAA